jgi:hypothetical protein
MVVGFRVVGFADVGLTVGLGVGLMVVGFFVGALVGISVVGDSVLMQWQQLSFALPYIHQFPPKSPKKGQPGSSYVSYQSHPLNKKSTQSGVSKHVDELPQCSSVTPHQPKMLQHSPSLAQIPLPIFPPPQVPPTVK